MIVSTVLNQPIEVLCIKASEGVAGAREAFERLEGALPALKGRRFYGALDAEGVYRACVARQDDDRLMNASLQPWTLPGGWYARTRITQWPDHIPEIATAFKAMAARYACDASRPSIEHYRSQRELILLMPIVA